MSAFVSLIGAGPGDPGLLTLRGKAALEAADVVLYDYLASPELLRYAPQAERIFVGKKGFSEYISQEDINRLIVEKALEDGGKRVARLKGGDVFVFGRGGEEAEACLEAGIPFEVVPGISSAIAAAAYAGIPITHREAGSSFAVLTGNEMLRDDERLDYRAYAGIDTLVFLMGVRTLPRIVEKLLAAGKDPGTPAATIQWGTTPRQRAVSGPLADLPRLVQEAGIEAPAVTVVGEVARYRARLRWFDRGTLFGRAVAVTRTREGNSRLGDLLRQRGARVLEVPLIRHEGPQDPQTLYRTLSEVANGAYRWLLFTSQQGVSATFAALDEMGFDARALAGTLVAAVGPATARELEARGVRPDFVPSQPGALHLGRELPARPEQAVLHLTSQLAEDALERSLEERGLTLARVEAYRTLPAEVSEEARAELAEAEMVTLASGSAARAFAALAGTDFPVAVMGPQTEAAAREVGFARIVAASEPSLEALVEAVERGLNS
ncbi:uroporphyrinogen III methyltransferase/synthase [Deinobacterium chartae]|uniref:uroporphyrinogen-III C-methyltransferase n=1 Tax=Deinobacterium chartae TaxID=521158 RepID=A0A841I0W5_9DEIO|nr:uroporphyrinogen-III C-methyltransferase [Deinobacterium chartae]MBB6099431.1 uroporphyrinogen III methyltransferase/synthase [Deinobacterium chartae]